MITIKEAIFKIFLPLDFVFSPHSAWISFKLNKRKQAIFVDSETPPACEVAFEAVQEIFDFQLGLPRTVVAEGELNKS